MLHTHYPTKAEILRQMEKILHSQSLHGSESLRLFLQFVVTKAVDKQESQLKEYTIATEVFGRDGAFDPRVDSVVRVQAGRLRIKVQEYYTTEGKHDSILIDLPKGQYSPSFSYLKTPETPALAESREEYVPSKPVGPPNQVMPPGIAATQRPSFKRDRRLIVALSLLSIALASSTFFFYGRAKENQPSLPTPRGDITEMRSIRPLWQEFIQSPEPVLIAYSNTVFEGIPETGMKLLAPLDSVRLKPGMAQPLQPLTSAFRDKVITQHYTGVGEVMGVYLLGEYFGKLGRSVRVKRSLLLTWEDLKSENFIFLGSSAENLLLRDLPQEQQFIFRTVKTASGKSVFGIVNLKPKPGEENYYLARQEGPSPSQISEDYALISLLRGLNPKTRLLILAGISTYGTQAAVEYVVKPEYAAELVSHLNIANNRNAVSLPPYYQALIRVKVNGEVPVHSTYVTHHVLN